MWRVHGRGSCGHRGPNHHNCSSDHHYDGTATDNIHRRTDHNRSAYDHHRGPYHHNHDDNDRSATAR